MPKRNSESGRPHYGPLIIIENYCREAKENWTQSTEVAFKERLYRFYRWLKKSGFSLEDITLNTLGSYRRKLKEEGCSPDTVTQYMRTIHPFLRWLAVKGFLGTTLVDLELEKEKFPLFQSHLNEITHPYAIKLHKIYVYEFYVFLKSRRWKIESVDRKCLLEYEQDLRTQRPARTVSARRMNMRCVHNHIRWLVKNSHLSRSLAELEVFREKRQINIEVELPDVAKDFLRLSLTHHKRSTVIGRRTHLKHFYKFLNDRQLSICEFTRKDFEEYSKRFHDAGFASNTTRHLIGCVQLYLSWLYKCGYLEKDPEPIIENFPRPQVPDTLPRYLLPEVDTLLKKHLEESTNIVAHALNLMRRIGIRIGDLRNLEYDCLRKDDRGYWYIKIPLGKLNKERLFPLDEKSLVLVQKLKALSRKHNGGRDPEKLVIHPRGKPPGDTDYYYVLYEISEKIRVDCNHSLGDEPLVSHRLRHTFATTLLSAGIELATLRELLGHRSLSMTLRYARVMPQKLRGDYLKAVDQLKKDVLLPTLTCESKNLPLTELLHDLLGRLRSQALEPGADKKRYGVLIRRTKRLKAELAILN
jgi:site-specific recombinase XerD